MSRYGVGMGLLKVVKGAIEGDGEKLLSGFAQTGLVAGGLIVSHFMMTLAKPCSQQSEDMDAGNVMS